MSAKTLFLCLFAAIGIAQTGLFFEKNSPFSIKNTQKFSKTSSWELETRPESLGSKLVPRPRDRNSELDTVRPFFEKKLAALADSTRPEKLHLTLDRTLLAPSEDLWFTCWLRDAADLGPSKMSDIVHVELLDPRGSVILKKSLLALGGVAAGEFHFEHHWAGGQYKIRAFTSWMKNTGEAFERDLVLQKTVLPNLRLKLDFERKAFGPGEVVIAKFDALSLENAPISGKKIDFSIKIGGADFQKNSTSTDENGRAYVRFELPKDLATNDALLNISLENNGQTEAISRAVPIVLGKIDLQFFPEGGDAVAGFFQKIAFKALNEFGKPADVSGEIFDSKNEKVATFSSFHDGMGAVGFTQKIGESYFAKLTNPATCSTVFPLPAAVGSGVSLSFLEKKGADLIFEIRSTQPAETVYFTGVSGDKLLIFNKLDLKTGSQKITVPTADWPRGLGGIARFTLFDEKMTERAERLAFVNRDRQLKIELTPDKEKYLPRERVNLHFSVKDDQNRPVKGQFAVAVADDKLLTFADDKQGNLVAELMLQSDVKGKIEEPNFYFDPTEKDAELALDYLLMTQGWRRFGWKTALAGGPLVFLPLGGQVQNRPERARIAGNLYDFEKKKAISGEKLSLYPAGPEVKTDKQGHYDFGAVDLQRFSHIQYGKWSFFPLNDYNENLNLMYFKKGQKLPNINVAARLEESNGKTILAGTVLEPAGGAFGSTVKVLKNNQVVAGAMTDLDGNYFINLDPGVYDLEFGYVGWTTERRTDILIVARKKNVFDKVFDENDEGVSLTEAVTKSYMIPLIQQDKNGCGFTAEQIRDLPTKNLNAILATTAGVTSIDGGDVNIRGSRDNAANYYIDGIRTTKNNLPPTQDIDQAQKMANGTPAEFENDGSALMECVVVVYKKPLTSADQTTSGQTFFSNDLAFRTVRSYTSSPGYSYQSKPKRQPYRPERQLAYVRARQFYVPRYDHYPTAGQRTDFRPTIFWSPNVETNEKGEAEVHFFTSDALTTFKITAEGIGKNGQVGHAEKRFFAQKPVQLDCKLPTQVQVGDFLKLQVLVKNNTAAPVSGTLGIGLPKHFSTKNSQSQPLELAAGESKTIEIGCEIGQFEGPLTAINIQFFAQNSLSDAVSANIKTVNRGFPVTQVLSGNAAQNLLTPHLVNPIEGTVSAKITAYPSALEDLMASMERMLRQPSGCFEQVSSSNYPNLLVLDFLKKTNQLRPETEARARQLLEDGYKKLIAYESKSGGFDWYGRDPGHEGLTAYGILEFTDMARVFPVDQKMIDRTADWLLSRRDGKGGWKRNLNGYDSFSGENAPNSYIVWSLAEAGFGEKIADEINATLKKAEANGDIYQQALLANALLKTGDARAKPLISNILEKQKDDGSFPETGKSAMGGYGNAYKIETASLVALALMRSERFGSETLTSKTLTSAHEKATRKAIQFILKNKNEYGYGSTQSTVFALRALIEYAVKTSEKSDGGQLVVTVDGQRVAEENYSAGQFNPLKINDLEKYFKNDNPKIEVFFEGTKTPLPFDFELKYAASRPRDAKDCPLVLTTVLEKSTASIGETVRLTASVLNDQKEFAASPMLIVGIPAGLSLQPWQLKKLGDEKAFDFYELWDGFAVFHFEKLAPGEKRDLKLDLRAEIPGKFEAPASQAFLYYSNEMRVFARPAAVELL